MVVSYTILGGVMKLVLEDNKTIIFFNKLYLNDFNVEDKKDTEQFLRDLVNRIKVKYNLEFNGYYNINIYVDQFYGFIISIEKEELEYFDYFNGQMEFSIKIIKNEFLYKLEEILSQELLSKCIVYKSKDKFYVKPKVSFSAKDMGILMENARVIYNAKIKEIIYNSQIMKG